MRSVILFSMLVVLVGACVAQDTNFSAGPQYLMNYGSPLLFQPIATPTLSLDAPLPPSHATSAEATTQVPSTSAQSDQAPQNPLTPAEIAQNRAAFKRAAEARIYWGQPPVTESSSEIEITSAAVPASLPASIADNGVAHMVDVSSLRAGGYGQPVGEVASYWKAHKRHAPRVYTNADIARFHRD